MKKKITFVLPLAIALAMSPVLPALAQTDTPTTTTPTTHGQSSKATQAAANGQANKPTTASTTPSQADKTTQAANQLTRAKTQLNRAIDQRISRINRLITRINNTKRLSDTTKTALVELIQNDISSLTALKTQVSAATSVDVLKGQIKTLNKTYRTYAFYIPKIHLLGGADSAVTAFDELSQISTDLQAQITTAQAAGKDTTALETQLADMNAKITAGKAKAGEVTTQVTSISQTDTDSKVKLVAARNTLKDASVLLRDARILGHQITNSLRALNGETTETDQAPAPTTDVPDTTVTS